MSRHDHDRQPERPLKDLAAQTLLLMIVAGHSGGGRLLAHPRTVTGRLLGMHEALHPTRDVVVPLGEIVLRASRSSGPGGQHANVTASRIEASFDVAASEALTDAQKARVMARCGPVLRAVAQDARSQARNRELALRRLEQRLAH